MTRPVYSDSEESDYEEQYPNVPSTILNVVDRPKVGRRGKLDPGMTPCVLKALIVFTLLEGRE